MLVFARELQKQSLAHGAKLVSVAAHPGLSSTAIGRELTGFPKLATSLLFSALGQDDAQGALPQLYAATAAGLVAGGYYGPDGFQEFKGYPAPAKVAAAAEEPSTGPRLWSLSEQLTGVVYDWPARS